MEQPPPDNGVPRPELEIIRPDPQPENERFPYPPDVYRKSPGSIIEEEEGEGPGQPQKPTLH